jgi:hypothetical protein
MEKGEKAMSVYSDKIAQQKQQQKDRGLYKLDDFVGGKEFTHTISSLWEDQVMFEREMDILNFSDTGRQLEVNVQRGETLIKLFGDDPKLWEGKDITLYTAARNKKGDLSIYLRAAGTSRPAMHEPSFGNGQTLSVAGGTPSRDMDDEIPSKGDGSLSGREALSSP